MSHVADRKLRARRGTGLRAIARTAMALGAAALGASALAALAAAQAPAPAAGDGPWAMLDEYCVTCHNAEDWAGGVAFDTMKHDGVATDAKIWETAVRKMRGRLMPPAGEPQPPQADVDKFVAYMEATLDATPQGPRAGYVPVQRLTRTEYAITVKGLLGVDIDPKSILPTEIEVEGFENIAAALGTSPSFIEQYLGAARKVARLAVGEAKPKLANVSFTARGSGGFGGQPTHQDGFPLGTRGGMKFRHTFPADGEYRFSITDADAVDAGLYPRGMENESTLVVLVDDHEVFRTQLGGQADLELADRDGPAGRAKIVERLSNIPAKITAGEHDVTFTFIERSLAESDSLNGGGFPNAPRVQGEVQVAGPYDPTGLSMSESRKKIFVCTPASEAEEKPCADRIARRLARLAYRRPVTDADVAELAPFFAAGRESTGTFDGGVEQMITAILVSPHFLYRAVTPSKDEADGEIYALDDLELASRLSFFLWSQGPDDELLDLAAAGELSKPEVMDAQVRRMLADERAHVLVSNFAEHWLNLDDLDVVEPEDRAFTPQTRESFEREADLFLSSVLLGDRSVLDLITADYTYLNESLAQHYRVPGVHGPQFRRVQLTDENRWGILGKGAILLRTSYANRTSPVLRGAFVLDKLMGTPPTPPPPGVSTDINTPPGQRPTTVRARLEKHREDPSCAACHGLIDPLGLALENFDNIGRWREVDGEARAPIDPKTELTSGKKLDGVRDLREHLVSHPDLFVQNLTERLMMFALGREVEYSDMPQVRAIVHQAAKENYTLSAIVRGIVASDAFRMQASPELAQGEGSAKGSP